MKWGLLYGVLLCNARAMGEFGAVSVVSGHIRGLTNTMPLHVEILYNEYNFVAAFAVASLLALLALVTLVLKSILEWRFGRSSPPRAATEPSEKRTMSIKVKEVVKRFDGFTALDGVSLRSTPASSWRCSAVRLRQDHAAAHHRRPRLPDGGKIKMDGIDASTKHVGARNVGFVFQHYALFRHMTVFENVAFGLRVKPRRLRRPRPRSASG